MNNRIFATVPRCPSATTVTYLQPAVTGPSWYQQWTRFASSTPWRTLTSAPQSLVKDLEWAHNEGALRDLNTS